MADKKTTPLFSVNLYALTIFTSAFLLFMVQPLFSKIVLPSLGGATAVWVTLMFVYQGLLLLGYGYAHALSHWVPRRVQVPLHILLLALSFLTLPLAAHANLALPENADPILWLVKTALLGVGLPFFVLSATSPLIQHWFAHTPHGENKNPYVLYAVSNFGSLLALLGYPLILERFLPLNIQSNSWLGVYIGYGALIFACGLITHTFWRSRTKDKKQKTPDPIAAKKFLPKVPKRQVLHWLGLSLVPSSMLLGVTSFITTQVASVPLLWVVPLALYLATFIFAFAEKQYLKPDHVRLLAGAGLIGLLAIAMGGKEHVAFALVWHLATFFFIALALHQILASKKPAASKLTGFYFVMSLGGVLGGALNAIAAPMLFSNIYEYPLALALAGILLWPYQKHYFDEVYQSARFARALELLMDIAVPLALLALVVLPGRAIAVGSYALDFANPNAQGIAMVLAIILAFVSLQKPFRLAAGVSLILAGGLFISTLSDDHTFTKRSFYGTYSVVFDSEELSYKLISLGSSATQGKQSIDPEHTLSTLYFYNLKGAESALPAHIYASDWGVVGLGVGTLACLSPVANKTTFIEIDPLVVDIARDSGYFTYLADCPGENPVIVGDGRAKMATFEENSLGAIALDAFTGAAIPVHTLTLEAFGMYLDKLTPDGVIMVNISNMHMNLLPLIARQAKELGLYGVHRRPVRPTYSYWVFLSKDPKTLEKLGNYEGWEALPEPPQNLKPWTDSFATILPLVGQELEWAEDKKAAR